MIEVQLDGFTVKISSTSAEVWQDGKCLFISPAQVRGFEYLMRDRRAHKDIAASVISEYLGLTLVYSTSTPGGRDDWGPSIL